VLDIVIFRYSCLPLNFSIKILLFLDVMLKTLFFNENSIQNNTSIINIIPRAYGTISAKILFS
jgi:hypothetical protein